MSGQPGDNSHAQNRIAQLAGSAPEAKALKLEHMAEAHERHAMELREFVKRRQQGEAK